MKWEISIRNKELKTVLIYMLICLSVIGVVILLNTQEVFNTLEYALHDARFRIRGVEPHNDDIVIVAIDKQTLDLLGIYGMPARDYHVKLIENLYKAGAKAVLFDVLFLSYTGELSTGEDNLAKGNHPSHADSLLSQVLKKYPNTIIARKLKVEIEDATGHTTGETPYPPELFRYPHQMAFVDMFQDNDSFIRRTKLVGYDIDPSFGWDYSFALKATMYAIGADTAWVDTKKHIAYVGDRTIPLDEQNFMIIDYAMDEESFQKGIAGGGGYISYEQVLDDSEWGLDFLIKENRLKDKVVLVGAAWPESGDVKQTPFYLGNRLFSTKEYPMYGVHVHKNIATTILENRFIPPTKRWQFITLVIFMSILATVVNFRFRGFLGLFLSIVLIVVYSGIAVALFTMFRRMIPVVAPCYATVFFIYLSAVTYNFLTERKQKAMIRGAFAQYVPPSVVNELLKDPEKLTLGGEERVLSVIFSDVAGFTTISETLRPTQLVELLNEYLTAMTDIVLKYDGIIDKYEGDAIMAEFGAPIPDDEHAVKACFAAIDMQVRLVELREKLKSEGKPELRARVGINSGPMVVGNMGSQRIFDYTVMGDNVNLSSRLEGANKAYGTYIMCSEMTRQMAEHVIITRELDLLRVKGKTKGVKVHEIIAKKDDGISEEKKRVLEIYHNGLTAYKERRWDDGILLFSDALKLDPNDTPSTVYLERCQEFKLNPPPEDWDGIFTMRTK